MCVPYEYVRNVYVIEFTKWKLLSMPLKFVAMNNQSTVLCENIKTVKVACKLVNVLLE